MVMIAAVGSLVGEKIHLINDLPFIMMMVIIGRLLGRIFIMIKADGELNSRWSGSRRPLGIH